MYMTHCWITFFIELILQLWITHRTKSQTHNTSTVYIREMLAVNWIKCHFYAKESDIEADLWGIAWRIKKAKLNFAIFLDICMQFFKKCNEHCNTPFWKDMLMLPMLPEQEEDLGSEKKKLFKDMLCILRIEYLFLKFWHIS